MASFLLLNRVSGDLGSMDTFVIEKKSLLYKRRQRDNNRSPGILKSYMDQKMC